MADPKHERMHPVGGEGAWSESYYFNFVDPDARLAMFTRIGFRPRDGWADALHVVYLEGSRVAFTYGRRDIGPDLSAYDDDLSAGDLAIRCIDPYERWQIHYDGPTQDIADAAILLTRRKERSGDWFRPATLCMDIDFNCLTEPHFAASGPHGHFEQSGRVAGSITVDDEQWNVAGYGVRDKSWGPRDWGAGQRSSDGTPPAKTSAPSPFVNWFSMNFGESAALGGSCFRHADGAMHGEGWIQRDGQSKGLTDVVIESDYRPDSILHTAVRLTGTIDGGETLRIHGKVLSVCPTKVPMPGGATFINEGLTEFDWDGRQGFGIAEHWHAVSMGR